MSTETKILCVDDTAANLLSLRAAFADLDYLIVEAQSGREALEQANEQDFAVILLDVQMPLMDGFETARRIREDGRGRYTPIIFLTANYPGEQHALEGYEAGAVDYLFKPLNISVLRAKVASFVELFRTKQRLEEALQREKERELAEVRRISNRKYQNLVEGIRDGIVWSADPITLQFTFVSSRAPHITGYPLPEWFADRDFWAKRLPPDSRDLVLKSLQDARATDARVGFEHRFFKSNGDPIWFHTEVHMEHDLETGRAELHGLSVDVTHLKETERALRDAIRVRDEFLSIASHELRTPITPLQLQMQGFIRMIETGKLEKVPAEKLRSMLQISDAQVTRLARLIGQLLDVSRLSNGRLSLQPENANLAELVRGVLDQLHYELDTAECQLRTQVPDRLLGTFDRLRLEQVLVNLMTNAMKYAAGKTIEVSLTACADDRARLVVRDHGIGIAVEDQQRIFECFERAVPTKNFGGLGLGLYISKQIVELHQGTIAVESQPGQGATFIVELPLEPQLH